MSLYDDIPEPKVAANSSNPVGSSRAGTNYVTSVATVATPRIIRSANAQLSQEKPISQKYTPTLPTHSTPTENPSLTTAPAVQDYVEHVSKVIFDCIPTSQEEYDPANPIEYRKFRFELDTALSTSLAHLSRSALAEDRYTHKQSERKFDAERSSPSGTSDDESDGGYGSPAKSTSFNTDFFRKKPTEPSINRAVSGMMSKMGWTTGMGLGKAQQGRLEPVTVVGIDGRGGLGKAVPVVHFSEKPEPPNNGKPARPHSRRGRRRKPMSRVLLIQLAILGVHDLESELRSLCAPHGLVEKVEVCEDTEASNGQEQSSSGDAQPLGQAFVLFSNTEAASRALLALDGIDFFGRPLRTSLYPEPLFHRMKAGDTNSAGDLSPADMNDE